MTSCAYTIQYHVTSRGNRKQILQIWELVREGSQGTETLLYQINYELNDLSSAHRIINHLLEAAGAKQLTPYQFEKLQGKLKVNPNPTLRLFSH
ncbi:MAG: hypothetical protein ACOYME_09695 [Prochlorotrichaceae cyanobacterium]|jgi:propanediol dehydratase small subunit